MSFMLIIYGVLIGVLLGGSANGEDDPYQHAVELLSKYPLIDGYYSVTTTSYLLRLVLRTSVCGSQSNKSSITLYHIPSFKIVLREPIRYFSHIYLEFNNDSNNELFS